MVKSLYMIIGVISSCYFAEPVISQERSSPFEDAIRHIDIVTNRAPSLDPMANPYIGMVVSVQGASVDGQANWTGVCDQGSYRDTAVYNPPPGWVVVSSKLVVTNNNNGSASMSVAAAGLNIASKKMIEEVYKSEIDGAIKANHRDQAAKLKTNKKQHLRDFFAYKTNKNTVSITATANPQGSCGDRKGGSIRAHADIKLIYLEEANKNRLRNAIYSRSFL